MSSKQSEVQYLREQNSQQMAENKSLRLLIEKLQAQLEQLLRILYGKKSERKPKDSTPPEENGPEGSAQGNKNLPGQKENNNKPKRNKLPADLPREVIQHYLPESELGCECGHRCHIIGKEVSEQLEYLPARLYVKEHRRYKYACQRGCCVKIAPLPAQPIEKGIPGPGLLADVLISKYQDAMPLYRQSKRFERHHVTIPDSTLGDWVEQCSILLEPIVNAMKQDLLRKKKIHTDDTPVPVLAKGKTKQARLWVYIADGKEGQACTLYDYSASRAQTAPEKYLEGYRGYLQADAYAGYDVLYKTGQIIEVACLAHVRRKFFEIASAVKSDTLAHDALELIGEIYEVEKRCRHLESRQRYYYRKKHLKFPYRRFYRWLKRKQAEAIPNTPIAKAINYALNHWRALQNVLGHGLLEVDNNIAERKMKPVVIGRKNWLFAGSHEGGKRSAVIYSIIESAKDNSLNLFEYITDVLTRLPTQLNSRLYELLPYNWQPKQAGSLAQGTCPP